MATRIPVSYTHLDAHTSILLAVAEWAVRNKEHLVGKYKFICQPAEEGVRGGLAVANGGIFDDVDEILCFHVGPECKLGEVGICEGGYLATTCLLYTSRQTLTNP